MVRARMADFGPRDAPLSSRCLAGVEGRRPHGETVAGGARSVRVVDRCRCAWVRPTSGRIFSACCARRPMTNCRRDARGAAEEHIWDTVKSGSCGGGCAGRHRNDARSGSVSAPGTRHDVDVRETTRGARALPGAVHLGRGVIERDVVQRFLNKGTPLVLYCGAGYRSCSQANLQDWAIRGSGLSQVARLGWPQWAPAHRDRTTSRWLPERRPTRHCCRGIVWRRQAPRRAMVI